MKLNKYFTIAAAALALVACDKNNDDFNIDDTKDTPITIASVGVAELTTRAITDGKLVGTSDSPATMSVFIKGSGSKYNSSNAKWEHNGTSWDSETDVFYEGTNSQQKIYACSPFLEGLTGSFAVEASDQTDWLVATEKQVTSNRINLTMTHALAKLVFLDPTFGNEVTSQTITSVEVGGMYASGTLKISDNTWSSRGTANATFQMVNNELLVIPMESCTSFPITITMDDNRKFKATISLATVGNKLEAGTQYNIALQIGQDKVTLGGINAEPWVPSTGGVLETE